MPLDLALLLDMSGSIGSDDWKKIIQFSKDVVDTFDISEKETHIAFILYATKVIVEVNFNQYKGVDLNPVSIKRDIDNFKQEKGLTFIDKALIAADTLVFTKEAGMREKAQKVGDHFTMNLKRVKQEFSFHVKLSTG